MIAILSRWPAVVEAAQRADGQPIKSAELLQALDVMMQVGFVCGFAVACALVLVAALYWPRGGRDGD